MWNADVACLFASMPVCADCLDKARIWERIGLSIQRAARRAEVAGLVDQARRRHDSDCAWWDDDPCECSAKSHNAAISRLARLAGGGA